MKKKRKLKEGKAIETEDTENGTGEVEMSRRNKRKKKGLSKGDIGRSSIRPKTGNTSADNPFEPCDVSVLKNFGEIKTKDVQSLILHYLGCTKSCPEWALVTNRGDGHHVCVVMVEALYPYIYKMMGSSNMPNFSTLFPDGPVELLNPGSEMYVTPAGSAILEKEPRKKSNDSVNKDEQPLPPVQEYILSQDHRLAHEYPSEDIVNKEPSWCRFTGNIAVKAKEYPLYAIDCEMCKTEKGSEVTQIAIVDESLNCIYKTYIKPATPILDYVTAYSGITAEIMKGVKTTLPDVIKHINDILPTQAVFVGHSLENDIRVLKLYHDQVIDTATIYSSAKGGSFKPGLRFLAMRFLKAKIQCSDNGHDPSEDAMTCMRLVKLKVKRGPKFGGVQSNNDMSLSKYLTKQTKTGVFIDKPIVAQQHCHGLAQALPMTSDEQGLETLLRRLASKAEFYWFHMYKLEPIYRACSTIHDMINNPELGPALQAVDTAIKQIYTALPSDALLVVFSGCSGYWKKPEFNGSDEAIKKLMVNIVAQVRKGTLFLKVKN